MAPCIHYKIREEPIHTKKGISQSIPLRHVLEAHDDPVPTITCQANIDKLWQSPSTDVTLFAPVHGFCFYCLHGDSGIFVVAGKSLQERFISINRFISPNKENMEIKESDLCIFYSFWDFFPL